LLAAIAGKPSPTSHVAHRISGTLLLEVEFDMTYNFQTVNMFVSFEIQDATQNTKQNKRQSQTNHNKNTINGLSFNKIRFKSKNALIATKFTQATNPTKTNQRMDRIKDVKKFTKLLRRSIIKGNIIEVSTEWLCKQINPDCKLVVQNKTKPC
jgi:hypothetical protein